MEPGIDTRRIKRRLSCGRRSRCLSHSRSAPMPAGPPGCQPVTRVSSGSGHRTAGCRGGMASRPWHSISRRSDRLRALFTTWNSSSTQSPARTRAIRHRTGLPKLAGCRGTGRCVSAGSAGSATSAPMRRWLVSLRLASVGLDRMGCTIQPCDAPFDLALLRETWSILTAAAAARVGNAVSRSLAGGGHEWHRRNCGARPCAARHEICRGDGPAGEFSGRRFRSVGRFRRPDHADYPVASVAGRVGASGRNRRPAGRCRDTGHVLWLGKCHGLSRAERSGGAASGWPTHRDADSGAVRTMMRWCWRSAGAWRRPRPRQIAGPRSPRLRDPRGAGQAIVLSTRFGAPRLTMAGCCLHDIESSPRGRHSRPRPALSQRAKKSALWNSS